MKQGTVFTKIIFLLLLLALIVYAITAAITALEKTITTVTAIYYEVGDGIQATGFVVRDEKPLSASGGISVLMCDEGERVAKGATLATTFADEDAQEAQRRIDTLEKELAQYEDVLNIVSLTEGNAVLDEQIEQYILQITEQSNQGTVQTDFENLETLKSLVLRRSMDDDSQENMQQQVLKLRSEIANLRTRLAGTVTQITAETAGYFSGTSDGFETVLTPDSIMTMSPAELASISESGPQPTTNAIGRLIRSTQWYFVCALPQNVLSDCGIGDTLSVEFSNDFPESLSMQVERISDPVDGQQILVLSCEDYIAEAVSLRSQTVSIVLHTYTGLRVPKKALHYDNQQQKPGVYVLEGARVRWKSVEIVYETADYFIILEDKSEISHLWPGDEVILIGSELKDGKVIE